MCQAQILFYQNRTKIKNLTYCQVLVLNCQLVILRIHNHL
jgi:hypothetical protein